MNETLKRELADIEDEVLAKINDHPLHAAQIANKLQIEVGKVNNAVLSLRSRGYLICGDDAYDGYYTGCLAQVERTLEQLKEKQRLLGMAIQLMERSVSKKKEELAEEQQTIWKNRGVR